MTDPTAAENAARKITSVIHPHEWLDPERQRCHECVRLAEIILRHMQPVIDAARAEGDKWAADHKAVKLWGDPEYWQKRALAAEARADGCKPTQDDKAVAESWWNQMIGVASQDIERLAEALAQARAEGWRGRDQEVECKDALIKDHLANILHLENRVDAEAHRAEKAEVARLREESRHSDATFEKTWKLLGETEADRDRLRAELKGILAEPILRFAGDREVERLRGLLEEAKADLITAKDSLLAIYAKLEAKP